VDQPRRRHHGSRAGRDRRRDQLQSQRQLAAAHGDAGWHAHAFPLSVDGVEIVASLVLLADRRAGRKSGWLPWTALTIGTVASLAANIATADYGIVSRVIAGWPAVALLIAVKLLSGILEHRSARTVPGPASLGAGKADGTGNGNSTARTRRAGGRSTAMTGSVAPDVAAGTVPGTADLITAERAARDALHQDGQPLTRDALAAQLRAAGHPVRYSRLIPLLRTLRTGPAPQTP
jgi:hypothetical protein